FYRAGPADQEHIMRVVEHLAGETGLPVRTIFQGYTVDEHPRQPGSAGRQLTRLKAQTALVQERLTPFRSKEEDLVREQAAARIEDQRGNPPRDLIKIGAYLARYDSDIVRAGFRLLTHPTEIEQFVSADPARAIAMASQIRLDDYVSPGTTYAWRDA